MQIQGRSVEVRAFTSLAAAEKVEVDSNVALKDIRKYGLVFLREASTIEQFREIVMEFSQHKNNLYLNYVLIYDSLPVRCTRNAQEATKYLTSSE